MEEINYARGQAVVLERISKWWDQTYEETLTTPNSELGGTDNG